jgi:hypothetical protein
MDDMTDKPATLALNARQWRVLLADHLDVMKGAVTSTENINEEALRNMYKHLDEMKMQATAWFQVSAAPAGEPAAQMQQEVQPAHQANGAAPKRKGGWQKGRKRGSPQPGMQ